MKPLLAGKFRIDAKIGEGSFSDMFCGTDIYSHEQVAVKVEKAAYKSSPLMYESCVYRCLSGGVGIPNVHWYGVGEPYNILVTDLHGPTIQNLFDGMDEFGSQLLLALAKDVFSLLELWASTATQHIEITMNSVLIFFGIFAITQSLADDVDLGDGLKKTVLSPGDGKTFPHAGDQLSMHYTGTLAQNGQKFDSSVDRGQPFTFTIGVGQVIQGWDVGVMSMSLGEESELHIPSQMGYGANGAGNVIPPNADLNFKVQLLKINSGEKMEG